MNNGIKSFLGWSQIVLAILVTLNQALKWAGWLQYIWAVLLLVTGIWTLAAKE